MGDNPYATPEYHEHLYGKQKETTAETQEDNPFVGTNYNIIQFTQLSRIYDVLMTLVQIQDPTAALRLISAHAEGILLSPSPQYTGQFVADGDLLDDEGSDD